MTANPDSDPNARARLDSLVQARTLVQALVEQHERLRQIAADGGFKPLAARLEVTAEELQGDRTALFEALMADVGLQHVPLNKPDPHAPPGWEKPDKAALAARSTELLEGAGQWLAEQLAADIGWTEAEQKALRHFAEDLTRGLDRVSG